jgi:hypothetical protein
MENLSNKDPRQADRILCGVGITRFDLPILYIRSVRNKIDNEENIFDIYFKTKPVDLGIVGISFFNREKVMYPKTANQLFNRFGMNIEKGSSTQVWDRYDNKEYEWIEKRCEDEVADAIKIYRIICERTCQKRKPNPKGKNRRR